MRENMVMNDMGMDLPRPQIVEWPKYEPLAANSAQKFPTVHTAYELNLASPSESLLAIPFGDANLTDGINMVWQGVGGKWYNRIADKNHPLTIGRSGDESIQLAGPNVSRLHARVEKDTNSGFRIVNIGSTPTEIRRVRVLAEDDSTQISMNDQWISTPLNDGSSNVKILIGSRSFLLKPNSSDDISLQSESNRTNPKINMPFTMGVRFKANEPPVEVVGVWTNKRLFIKKSTHDPNHVVKVSRL